MKWRKFSIKTSTEAVDIIISALYDIGFQGAQIEDKVPLTAIEKEQMFVDIMPETQEDDGAAILSFYSDTDKETAIKAIEEELDEISAFIDIGEGVIAVEETEDVDWINNWKQYFHQFTIDDLLVVPTWEEVRQEDRIRNILHIDPGTAFGTGMHETTQLCIRKLRKYVKPDTEFLDVGTGSGILAIVALMFGAKYGFLTDLDICAEEAVEQNCEVNGILKSKYTMIIGNIITDRELQARIGYEKYDIVVANILANVLVELTPVISRHLKKGGIYITSGIINEQSTRHSSPLDTVLDAVSAAGLKLLEVEYQGEWACVTAMKE